MFPHLVNLEGVETWKGRGVLTLADLYDGGVLRSLQQLQEKFEIPHSLFYRYLQLRHALGTQFRGASRSISKYPLIGVLRSQGPRGMVSILYTYLLGEHMALHPLEVEAKWKTNIPTLDAEDWEEAMLVPTKVSPSVNNRLTQLFILHRSYLSPVRLLRMGRSTSSRCHRCQEEGADFWHLMWGCMHLQVFWGKIVEILSAIVPVSIGVCPKICILGVLEEERWTHHQRVFLGEALFLARKAIALRWMAERTPTVGQWKTLMNHAMAMEKVVYIHRKCPQKFQKVWGEWCSSPHSLQSVHLRSVSEDLVEMDV